MATTTPATPTAAASTSTSLESSLLQPGTPGTVTANGTTQFAGTKLLSDGKALSTALDQGDWVAGGMAAFDLIDDALDAAADPVGTLVGAGLGWLLEHMQPLKGWLEQLAGSPSEVQQHAQAWATTATKLAKSGSDLARLISDLETQEGDVVEAYRQYQQQAAEHVTASSDWAKGISSSMAGASKIVTIVHDLVKKAFSELVSAAIQWVAEAAATLGLGMPFVIAQVINKVRTLVNEVMGPLKKLLESIKSLQGLYTQLTGLWQQFKSAVSGVVPGTAKVDDPKLTSVTAEQPATYGTGQTTDYLPPVGLSAADAKQLDLLSTQPGSGVTKSGDGYRLTPEARAALGLETATTAPIAGMDTAMKLAASSAAGTPGGGALGGADLGGGAASGVSVGGDGSSAGAVTGGAGGGVGGDDAGPLTAEQQQILDEWKRNAQV